MKGWEFQPARDRDLKGIDRYRSLKRENGLGTSVVRLFWWSLLKIIFSTWNRLSVVGHEHLPKTTPFILVANHCSHLDAPLLASILPAKWRDQISPIAASDTFFEKRLLAAFAAWFLNAFAIRRRSAGAHDLGLMRKRLQEEGAIFIVFPEGTRSRSGVMQTFKSGIGRLVAGSSTPVVPCRLEGCYQAWPPGTCFIKPAKVRVTLGKPMIFETCSDTREGWNEIAKALQQSIDAS